MSSNNYVAYDFVYCGCRTLANGELVIEIRKIIDGELSEPNLYGFNRKRDRMIGGIYHGATFSETSSKGIDSVVFVSKWDSSENLILWEALDKQARVEDRAKKLEKNEKKVKEIDTIMLPLRVQYENCRKRRDFAGMEAISKAVLISLRNSPNLVENRDI